MIRASIDQGLRHLPHSTAAPAALVAVVIFLYWSYRDGATDPLVSVPGSLLLIGMLVVVVWVTPGGMPGGRAGQVALVAFAAYTTWCFLSIAWSDVPARAWAGSNLTLVYFAIYALFAIRPWREAAASAVVGVYAVGVACIGIVTLLRLDDPDHLTSSFIAGRLTEPISYANANGALFAGAVVPALYLAGRRDFPPILRGVLLGSAGVLVQMAILCQSRMSLLASAFILACFLALVPGRLRSLLALLSVGAVVAFSLSTVLKVFEAEENRKGVLAAVEAAQHAILTSSAVLVFIGVAWGLIDRRLELPPRLVRVVGAGAIGLACLGFVAAAIVFVERYGSPVTQASVWWDKFVADDYVNDPGTPHLISGFGGAGRYDIWKVALELFQRHPVLGIGVDNFGVDWLRMRPNQQDVVSPHSVELRALQQTGLVGTALLVGFLAAVATAGWRTIARGPTTTRGTAAAAFLVFGYWLVHGSVDWLWEIPALSAIAFAALGLIVGLAPAAPRTVRPSWLVPAVVSAVGVIAVVTLLPPWSSARETEAALAALPAASAAYVRLDRARAWNPLTDEPDVLASVIAGDRGDEGRQRAFLLRAIDRNPYNWFPYLELGVIDARVQGRAAGLRWLAKARALNPNDATIQFAIEQVRAGHPPTRAELDKRILESADACCRP